MTRVALLDYGVGNVFSVRRALERLGAEVVQTSDPDVVAAASRVVLPGRRRVRPGPRAARRLGPRGGAPRRARRRRAPPRPLPRLPAPLRGERGVRDDAGPRPPRGARRPLPARRPRPARRVEPARDGRARPTGRSSPACRAGRTSTSSTPSAPRGPTRPTSPPCATTAGRFVAAARARERLGLPVPPREVVGRGAADPRELPLGGRVIALWPAIDLMGGKVVRLLHGDPSQRTVYPERAVEVAVRFAAEGADGIHVVDLDAAFGTGSNAGPIAEIVAASPVPVEVGGGLRDRAADRGGARVSGRPRVVLGSLPFRDPALFAELLAAHAARLVVALDCKEGRPTIHGWVEDAGAGDAAGVARRLAALGVAHAPRHRRRARRRDDGPEPRPARLRPRRLRRRDPRLGRDARRGGPRAGRRRARGRPGRRDLRPGPPLRRDDGRPARRGPRRPRGGGLDEPRRPGHPVPRRRRGARREGAEVREPARRRATRSRRRAATRPRGRTSSASSTSPPRTRSAGTLVEPRRARRRRPLDPVHRRRRRPVRRGRGGAPGRRGRPRHREHRRRRRPVARHAARGAVRRAVRRRRRRREAGRRAVRRLDARRAADHRDRARLPGSPR